MLNTNNKSMLKCRTTVILLIFFIIQLSAQEQNFRAPAYPLVTHDPYFSIWSAHEDPTQVDMMHWTLKPNPITILIRIDGKVYRLMGKSPGYIPSAKSVRSEVLPTSTVFSYQQDGLNIQLKFLSPLLLEDLDLVSRPLTYVSWQLESSDGKDHKAEIYFEISALASVNQKGQRVNWEETNEGELKILKVGSVDQPILEKSGDDLRIDWGYLYSMAQNENIKSSFIGQQERVLSAFANGESFPEPDESEKAQRVVDTNAVLAFEIPANTTNGETTEKFLMLAYDDIYSVEYFGERLEGYWKKKFKSATELFQTALSEYSMIKDRCENFDSQLMEKSTELGGKEYATICALAYRQCISAHKIVKDAKNEPLCFSKENFSNGSMGTVDVFYPASPFFLYLNPTLLKAQTTPIFDYAESGRWPWPYAPHDIGKYPLGNGQKYGGGELTEERQMPVEECGNMLILTAAIAKVDGNANYATKYWETITKWAEYLRDKGFDPENQLSTDDFGGHLAHNANLSVKAIMGIASYGMLCEMLGLKNEANKYNLLATEMAKDWQIAANDGDHYRLTFDKADTWSQKYNMVWDEILEFKLFPKELKDKEIKYYLSKQRRYGLPLDNRELYTKLDWILWTASMANTNEQFRELINPVYDFLNETSDRVPMSDWYWTETGQLRGFIARSVVGGVYMELLKDKMTNKN